MAFSFKAWFFERKFFCCCLPVRFGVIVMSFVTWVFSGGASFLLWLKLLVSAVYYNSILESTAHALNRQTRSSVVVVGTDSFHYRCSGRVRTLSHINDWVGRFVPYKQLFILPYPTDLSDDCAQAKLRASLRLLYLLQFRYQHRRRLILSSG